MSIKNCFKTNKNYVSKTDSFLHQFDLKNPQKSLSQQKEIDEYKRIFYRRDAKTKM